MPLDIVFLGLSITSSWGNGHATTYRSLIRALRARGHRVLFLERDVPWYAPHRDLQPDAEQGIELYQSLADLRQRFSRVIGQADAVIVGSFVPQGAAVGAFVQQQARGIVAFYDIDTPVTLARLKREDCDYLTPALAQSYHLYLSFTGGPVLRQLERDWGSPCARPLYCSIDPQEHRPQRNEVQWDLGYMGTYCADRQPKLLTLLQRVARQWREGRFIVAGPQYPQEIQWPENVQRTEHLPGVEHPAFYSRQRFTLNLTRADMVAAGYSPSVRLFEAAACGTAILTDPWPGLDHFFKPDEEVIVATQTRQVLQVIKHLPERSRLELARRARRRVLAKHTAAHRAAELEEHLTAAMKQHRRQSAGV